MGGGGVEDVFFHEEHDGPGFRSSLPREGPQNGLFVLKTRKSDGVQISSSNFSVCLQTF